MAKSSSAQKPTQVPPKGTQPKNASSKQTTPMENASKASVPGTTPASSPSENPPTDAKSEAAGTIWNKSAVINGLWGINEDKNSWVSIANVGWLKLSNASDSGIVALTMLASHAKQMGSTVYYREEDDTSIHELYVW